MCDRNPNKENAMRQYLMMNNGIITLVVCCRITCENCGATHHIVTTDGWIQRLYVKYAEQ